MVPPNPVGLPPPRESPTRVYVGTPSRSPRRSIRSKACGPGRAGLRQSYDGEHWRLPMRTTALLATALILAFATAALAGPRQGTVWQPCDYSTDWKIDGTSCG